MARVLIVEDEQMDRVILGSIVEGMGHVVYFASDGEQAFKTYMRSSIDVVVTDLVMPCVSGIEFIVELKTLFPDAPIIAVSAQGPELLAEAENKGASVTLSKPVDSKELLDAIAKVAPANLLPASPRSKVAARGSHRRVEEFEFEHKGLVRCVPAGAMWVDWLASTTEFLWDVRLNGTSVGQVEANLDETQETVHKAAIKLIDELPAQWIRETLANGALADSELHQEAVTPKVAEETAPPPPHRWWVTATRMNRCSRPPRWERCWESPPVMSTNCRSTGCVSASAPSDGGRRWFESSLSRGTRTLCQDPTPGKLRPSWWAQQDFEPATVGL